MNDFEKIKNCTSLSECARILFGDDNYYHRQKIKKLFESYGLDWTEQFKKKKRKFCQCCGKELVYGQKKYCSQSCAAKINNKLYKKRQKEQNSEYSTNTQCLYCGKEVKVGNKFCNTVCWSKYKNKTLIEEWQNGAADGNWNNGEIKNCIRDYIIEKNDYKCERCGFSGTNPYTGRTILQIHHKDGDCFNTSEENLECLCPNCHAMTENYGSRNKDCTRQDRRTKKYWLNNIKPTLENID